MSALFAIFDFVKFVYLTFWICISQGWVQFHMELGIEVINSNYTGIGIGIGIEIIFNPRIGIGIGIEYFLEKVIGIGIGIDQSNWCISSIPMKFQGHFFSKINCF